MPPSSRSSSFRAAVPISLIFAPALPIRIDFWESVYKRGGANSDLFTETLVRINKNFDIVPGAAKEWSVDSTGKVWTFKLDPTLTWSDDTPLTADDYVATFRYGADPKHAWDFTWFFNGIIANWDDAVAGKAPLESIGVTAPDKNTLQITTQEPAPYIPASPWPTSWP